jgi:DNA (cytosine-5)-methyltransferase 1
MKYDVLDMFSGCGGLSFGFHENNNFDIWGAFDTDKHANATYELNFGLKPLDSDIGSLSHKDIVSLLPPRKHEGLVVIGGPPCQGFSSHRKKDSRKDGRNSLVMKYAELGSDLGADVIIIENVPDLFAKKHWKHYSSTTKYLKSKGYSISSGIVNMAEFGVPQERFRAVIVATKSASCSLPRGHLVRGEFVTVRDAIEALPPLKAGGRCVSDPMHITSRHRKETVETIKQVPPDGGSRPKGVGPGCLDRVKGFYDVYGRLSWDKPAVTITARCRTPSCGRFIHPEQHRGMSVREAGLLQGFPGDFIFQGPFDDKFKQIGNAVPPLFSIALVSHLQSLLIGKRQNLDSSDEIQFIARPITNSFSTLIGSLKKHNGDINAAL